MEIGDDAGETIFIGYFVYDIDEMTEEEVYRLIGCIRTPCNRGRGLRLGLHDAMRSLSRIRLKPRFFQQRHGPPGLAT